MRLDRIIRNSGCTVVKGCGHIDVTAICDDSRKVSHGSLSLLSRGLQPTDMNTYPEPSAKGHA